MDNSVFNKISYGVYIATSKYEESFSGLNRKSNQPQHSLKPKPNPEQGPNSLI